MLVYNILIFYSTNSTDHSDSEISPVPPQNTNRQTNVTQGVITFKEGVPHEIKPLEGDSSSIIPKLYRQLAWTKRNNACRREKR